MSFPDTVGATATATRTVTQAQMDRFADLTGDDNPIHVDPDYARSTAFGATVAHGMHLYALVRALITERWPDAVEVSQDLTFPAPAHAGSTLEIRVGVVQADGETARLAADVTLEDTLVCRAETLVRRGSGGR